MQAHVNWSADADPVQLRLRVLKLHGFSNPARQRGQIDVDPGPRLRVGLLFPEEKRASATSKLARHTPR